MHLRFIHLKYRTNSASWACMITVDLWVESCPMISKWPFHATACVICKKCAKKAKKSIYKSRNKPNIPGRKLFAFTSTGCRSF